MQKQIRVNPFAAMKLEKQVRKSKGKQAFLRHVNQLQSEQRQLQNKPVITTIW